MINLHLTQSSFGSYVLCYTVCNCSLQATFSRHSFGLVEKAGPNVTVMTEETSLLKSTKKLKYVLFKGQARLTRPFERCIPDTTLFVGKLSPQSEKPQ